MSNYTSHAEAMTKLLAAEERIAELEQQLAACKTEVQQCDNLRTMQFDSFTKQLTELEQQLAERLMSEVTKQAEPVAYVHRFEKGTALSWYGESSDYSARKDWIGCMPLFDHPSPDVVELKAKLTEVTDKHDVACKTITQMQKHRDCQQGALSRSMESVVELTTQVGELKAENERLQSVIDDVSADLEASMTACSVAEAENERLRDAVRQQESQVFKETMRIADTCETEWVEMEGDE